MDETRFAAFYEQHARALRNYLSGISQDAELADDVAQEAFYRYLQSPPNSDVAPQQRSYLFRIATQLMHDHWRRKKVERRWRMLKGDFSEEPVATPDLGLSHDMAVLFDKLNQKNRTILWLAYVEGYAHRDIADIMGLQEKSIRVLLFRARKQMTTLLERHGYDRPEA